MYVFYPASRLVGLTIDYRDFHQPFPFPTINPSIELENESGIKENLSDPPQSSKKTKTAIEVIDNCDSKSDCFPRSSVSPCPDIVKSQSESPELILPKKRLNKKIFGKNPRNVYNKSPGSISLGENLKNLEVYIATKPLKRTWSLHFKKPTPELSGNKMAAMECSLREMTHPALNDTLKSHNAITFKLVKTGKFTIIF